MVCCSGSPEKSTANLHHLRILDFRLRREGSAKAHSSRDSAERLPILDCNPKSPNRVSQSKIQNPKSVRQRAHDEAKIELDCSQLTTREINQQLKSLVATGIAEIEVLNPAGRHNLGVGVICKAWEYGRASCPSTKIHFRGPVGYYCGGLGDGVNIEIEGPCGWSVGENLMSGQIIVRGNASSNAGASAHGGKICILGNAGPRTGISLKGATLIVTGNVGHSSAFMMQLGRLIICGNAGPNLGDSIYDGEIFLGGAVSSLGADARFDLLTDSDWQMLHQELRPWGIAAQAYNFKKIICAQELYHFQAKDFAKWKNAY